MMKQAVPGKAGSRPSPSMEQAAGHFLDCEQKQGRKLKHSVVISNGLRAGYQDRSTIREYWCSKAHKSHLIRSTEERRSCKDGLLPFPGVTARGGKKESNCDCASAVCQGLLSYFRANPAIPSD